MEIINFFLGFQRLSKKVIAGKAKPPGLQGNLLVYYTKANRLSRSLQSLAMTAFLFFKSPFSPVLITVLAIPIVSQAPLLILGVYCTVIRICAGFSNPWRG
jgi:hypothetical protein